MSARSLRPFASPSPTPPRAARARSRRGERGFSRQAMRGFSMVEALIAVALIGIVAVGLIPLFTRAMSDNMAGSDYTRVSNYARSDEEDFFREPFANYTSSVGSGVSTGQLLEYLNPTTLKWVQGSVPAGNPQIVWTRTTTYQQFSVNDMDDDQIFDNPLSGGTESSSIQLVQATVQVKSVSAIGPEGAHRSTTIRYLKAF
jgi:prepilin-type N-terminal cleavage/methylation domain-containing protein